MAFRSLKNYQPNIKKIDPRVDGTYAVNSNYCVMAISPYPTIKQTIEKGLISTLRLIGLINSYAINEAIAVAQFHEIGNKKNIVIPGKFRGSMQLSSNMFESINLLGSIAETMLDGFNEKYKNLFKGAHGKYIDFSDEILFKPVLNEVYFNDEKKEGSLYEDVTMAQGLELAEYYGIKDEYLDEGAGEASSIPDTSNKGAILLSIDDVRVRVKFGLCFIMFQKETRIPEDSLAWGYNDQFKAPSSGNVVESLSEIGIVLPEKVELNPINYKILAGQFYENCTLVNYSRNVDTSPVGGNISESVSIIYNGTERLKRNMTPVTEAKMMTSSPAAQT